MKYFIFILVFISFLLGCLRASPYIDGTVPLGYDPGIFRSYFLTYFHNLPNIDLIHIDTWIKQIYEPGLAFLTNIMMLLGMHVDFIISFGLVFFSLITGIFIYLNLKEHGKIGAYLGLSLYFISIVQYKTFWWNYYKQIIGILFLLSSIYLFHHKKYIIAIPLLLSMFIINRASGVFFILMFFFYKIYISIIERKITFTDIFTVGISGILALGIYFPIIKYQLTDLITPLVGTILSSGSSGTFFSREEFGFVSILLILGAGAGLYIKIISSIENNKRFTLLDFGFVIGLLWTSLGLFFYNRFYIFFDIFLIIFTGYFFQYLYEKNKKIFLGITLVFFTLQASFYLNYLQKNSYSLISQNEFNFINNFPSKIEKDAVIMVTHKNYSPWIIGYTGKRTIAPGLFDRNKWSFGQWESWWKSDGKDKCFKLKDYKEYKNLYLFIGERQPKENLINANCLEPIYTDNNTLFFKVKHYE